jgi:hypothetical protein
MKYKKPEIVMTTNAAQVIKGQMLKAVTPADNTGSSQISTPNAYEADE